MFVEQLTENDIKDMLKHLKENNHYLGSYLNSYADGNSIILKALSENWGDDNETFEDVYYLEDFEINPSHNTGLIYSECSINKLYKEYRKFMYKKFGVQYLEKLCNLD